MALVYPDYVVPKPGDFLSSLTNGYKFTQGILDNQKAKGSLSELDQYLRNADQPMPTTGGQTGIGQPVRGDSSIGSTSGQFIAPDQSQPSTLASLDPNGHPATVGDRAAELRAATGAAPVAAPMATSTIPDTYLASVAQAESSGDPSARNANSSATGLFQITDGTWNDLMRRHPELGLTPDGRTDPAQSTKAARALTADNAQGLSAADIPVMPPTLFAAHQLGVGGVKKLVAAPPDTPMAALFPDEAGANPQWAGQTVADYKQRVAEQSVGASRRYQPPLADSATSAGAVAIPPQAPMPPSSVMAALAQSPETRPLALAIYKARLAGQDPSSVLGLMLQQAQVEKARREAADGDVPSGYRRTANGLEAIPGGPFDPNSPTNQADLAYKQAQTAAEAAKAAGTSGMASASANAVGLDDRGMPVPQQQEAFLAALPSATAGLVKSVANYQADITKVTSLRGNQRQELAQLVQQYDPTFDMTQYGARAAMRKSITSGTYSQAVNSANLVIQHLDALSKATDALGNQGGILTPWNAVANAGKEASGNPAITTFNTVADAAAAELAKVFKGVGATDLQSVKDWRKNLNPNSSPEQIHAAINTAIGDLLKSRLDTINAQYQSAMGHPGNFTFLTPHSRQVLEKMGIDPTELDPNETAAAPAGGAGSAPSASSNANATTSYATNPQTGERLMLQNGQWVPSK